MRCTGGREECCAINTVQVSDWCWWMAALQAAHWIGVRRGTPGTRHQSGWGDGTPESTETKRGTEVARWLVALTTRNKQELTVKNKSCLTKKNNVKNRKAKPCCWKLQTQRTKTAPPIPKTPNLNSLTNSVSRKTICKTKLALGRNKAHCFYTAWLRGCVAGCKLCGGLVWRQCSPRSRTEIYHVTSYPLHVHHVRQRAPTAVIHSASQCLSIHNRSRSTCLGSTRAVRLQLWCDICTLVRHLNDLTQSPTVISPTALHRLTDLLLFWVPATYCTLSRPPPPPHSDWQAVHSELLLSSPHR